MLDKDFIAHHLQSLGYEATAGNSKTLPFFHPTKKITLILKVKTKHQPLVIHPDFQQKYSMLSNIEGVLSEKPMRFYHDATMRAFPERQNGGRVPTKYGLAFGFKTPQALQSFFTQLHGENVPSLLNDFSKIDAFPVTETERISLKKSRIGQGVFRDNLIDEFNGICPVTGLDKPELLVASHIIPWSKCVSNEERLDSRNGLLLAANVDALFDKGFISFDAVGNILISTRISLQELQKFGLNEKISINCACKTRMRYTAFHREKVFQK